MNPFKMPNLAMMMSARISPKDIGKIVDRLEITPSGNMENISGEAVSVASVQVLCKRYESLTDYVIDMNLYVEDAVNRRAQLIVFPAYTGLLPLSFMPQYDTALEKLRPREDTGLPDPHALNEVLSYYSDYAYETFYTTMSALAAHHQVFIMAGSTLLFEENDLYHRAFLFDDIGECIGYQDKVSLSPLEQELEVEPGAEIRMFDTIAGPISIIIAGDAAYYETGRAATGMGARLLLHPTAFTHDYTPVDAASGINLRVQENRVYGIQSVLVGDSGLGFTLEGPSCIFAPNEVVRSKNGILEQTSGRFSPDVLCRRL
ncbi:hypothetical protein LJC63_08605, partial [Ruminococcaceae bacterium OttesenSCG-928-L11]|nr:hypothetical protein [Ruminococcaceae bacterium OttesenSCG-928-L11]